MDTLRNLSLLLLLGILAGCNAGSAPEGMTADDAKRAFDAQPAEERIKQIQNSPADAETKARRIAEIKAQSGK